MAKCAKCERDFPDELLAPLISSKLVIRGAICALCAYREISRIHKRQTLPSPGTIAEWMYQEALKLYPPVEGERHDP